MKPLLIRPTARRPHRRTSQRCLVRTESLESRLLFATYTAVGDFALTQNPNGAWTYGETNGTTFTPDAVPTAGAGHWSGAGGSNVSAIASNSPIQSLEMSPGQSTSADLRWTAPADGTYSLNGSFTDNTNNASDDVHVTLNGVSLVSGNVGTGGSSSVPFSQSSITVHAGDNIDLIVGPGSDGWDANDKVAVAATISTSSGTNNNTSALTTTVAGRLPTKTLISGQRATPPFFQTVTLTNSGTTTITGPVTINLLLSANQSGAPGDPTVGTISRRVNLRAGRSIRFAMLVRTVPPNVSGDFFIVAQVTDPTALTSVGASSGTVTVAAPFRDMTGAFGAGVQRHAKAGRRILLPVIITNAGNVQAKGNLDVAIVATSNASTVSLGTITRRVVINPQRRQQLLLVETLPANLPAGTYTLTGTVDPNNVFNAPTVTNNTFVDPFPLTVT